MTEPITEFAPFDRLTSRYRIRGVLVAETGLRVGAGKSRGIESSDQPVIRDAMGRLFLPGSSLKGVLRSGLEAILRGLADERLACDPFDAARHCTAGIEARLKRGERVELAEVLRAVCVVCGLFGCSQLAGRVFVGDLPLAAGERSRTEVRDGVGINRDLRTAQLKPAAKFDHEVVPPGTRFDLEIILENLSDDLQLGLILRTLDLLRAGELRIGGQTSRGLGRVSLTDLRLERTDAKRLLAGQGYERLDFEAELGKSGDAIVRALHQPEGN